MDTNSDVQLKGRFGRDVIWTFGSFGVMSVAALLMNLIIAAWGGTEMLGIFNQAFALFIILSQLAVGGMFFSVLKHAADHAQDREKVSQLTSVALLIALFVSVLAAVLTYSLRHWLAAVFESPDIAGATAAIAPGLVFFALNKVFQGSFNGARCMRLFACLQGLRLVLYLGFTLFLLSRGVTAAQLPLALTLGEAVLFVVSAICFFRMFGSAGIFKPLGWWKTHLGFARGAFMTGLLLDTNTRVDIVMLGIFLPDAAVGIYSLAALIAEGFGHIAIAVQANVTPLLSQILKTKDQSGLQALIRRALMTLFPAMAGIGVLSAALYSPVLTALGLPEMATGWIYFSILAVGYTFAGIYLPFMQILNQAGKPGAYTLLLSLGFATNIVLNAGLIPLWGAIGAAGATAIAMILSIAYLKHLTQKFTGFRLCARACAQ